MQELRDMLTQHAYSWTAEKFFDQFVQGDGTFLDQETDIYDFKREWPFSYSDGYFASLARLISAFANTSGGLIVFGVHDETRLAVGSAVRANMDRLEQALSNSLSERPKLSHYRYLSEEHGQVDVVVVYPIPLGEMPLRFIRDLEKTEAGSFWVRVGHETLRATTKHIPLLFCRTGLQLKQSDVLAVDSSLPPSPCNIQKFVGRLDAIFSIFDWLYNSEQPRQFLWGRGGSGKTTIAYEIAKHVGTYGQNVLLLGRTAVEQVIFVSAKEKALNVIEGKVAEHNRDFTDDIELFRAILILGGWSDPDSLESLGRKALLEELKAYFDMISTFIVIDDIDTLTTKGVDAGLEDLYLIAARAQMPTKILYTLRNVPSNALANSIEVPGLQIGGEYEEFIKICSQQFRVEPPSREFQDGQLQTISERRPLVVESIIALRRRSDSYERALELFEQHGGDSVRQYVFKREWDALPADNRARYLLAALALLDQPATLEDLATLLQYDIAMVSDAVSYAREMFLDTTELERETAFELGVLTKSFVLAEAQRLDRFPTITERVKAFRRTFYPEKPALSRLIAKVERMLFNARNTRDKGLLGIAWSEITAQQKPDILEDPRYRAFKGFAATQMQPARLIEAREDFGYAMGMGFEPAIEYLRAWYDAEQVSGHGGEQCELIADFVGRGRTYSRDDKLDFEVRRASRWYAIGREILYDNPQKAIELLKKALLGHLRNFYLGVRSSHPRLIKIEEYARNTGFFLFMTLLRAGAYDEIFNICISAAQSEKLFLDPLEAPICEYTAPILRATLRKGERKRLHNHTAQLRMILSERPELWETGNVPSGLIAELNRIESFLSVG